MASLTVAPMATTRSPPAEGDRWRDLKLYALFAAFGGGASWFGTVLAFMEVPLYQRHFSGLELSNRLELGYNCGTVPAAAFLVALGVGWRASRRSRVGLVFLLLSTHGACVALLCVAVPGSPIFGVPALALAQFLGGSCGYLSQFVCVPYLVGGFENALVGAFWTGDAFTSVLAAMVALYQRPGAASPRFGLSVYLLATGPPVIAASLVAFMSIERTGAGRLAPPATPHGAATELVTLAPLLPEGGAEQRRPLAPIDEDKPADDPEPPPPPGWWRAPYLRDPLTWKLGAVVFWSQFADWGMGDSVYPYACANASAHPDVQGCEMWSNELSLFAQFVGCAAASRVPLDGAKLAYTLWIPTLVYTGWFGLLLFTSWRASDVLPRLSERGVLVDLVILRFLGPYARNVIPRLIQPCYAKVHHEDLPVLFGVLSVLGNVAGSLVATGLIGIHQFDYIPGA